MNYQYYPIYQLVMPEDSIMPDTFNTLYSQVTDPQLFDLSCTLPSNETQELALSTWINSHLLFFLSLNVGTYAAQQVIEAAAEQDLAKITNWLERLSVLRLSMVAFTATAANITREIYESYVRPAMSSMRSDFSGVSSKDNWVFDDTIRDMKLAINELINKLPASQSQSLKEAMAVYADADRQWWAYHGKVMTKLIAAPLSLARLEYQRQLDQGSTKSYEEFKHATLRTEKAVTENDMFFAVVRGTVSLQQFYCNLKHTLEVVRPLQDGNETFCRYFNDGEKMMSVIIEENLYKVLNLAENNLNIQPVYSEVLQSI